MRGASRIVPAAAVAALLALSGCSAGTESSEDTTLRIIYQKAGDASPLDTLMQTTKEQFEAANQGVTVELEPVEGTDEDYNTRLALSQRSPDTAPDVFYEDTFRLRSDVDAGYLLKLDEHLAGWDEWENFNAAAKEAGKADDGGTYAVPLGTDTRVIWYNKQVLQDAGIEVPWQPESWDDILEMARTVKEAKPDSVPFSMYAGTGTGEGTVMQSFYELLYGTESGGLYNESEQKWIAGSEGFVDSLAFLKTLYDEELAVTPAEALDPNVWQTVIGTLLPGNKMGGTVEGSYAPSFWQEGGQFEWAEYGEVMGVSPFPTQNGQEPGAVSMSGGWTLAVGAGTGNPDLAFEFLTTAMNQENLLQYTIDNSQIAVRTDIAEDPAYLEANPFVEDVSAVVDVTHYRPATSDYAEISTAVQEATEAVITGGASPEEAAATYDEALVSIVGEENVLEE
ncbi:multiple sugar transport system substrate-binding protein [Arthrobacter pigmenti]|uniref:Multiple sugar transport system substrate-binding protein n=1 Tax=Arthrobacter pigmenti TaxID=271432 RepID=A0A846RSU3_9MICC|nr:extracellular solute-binding protein [Arthrobacter pigmenti]NJC23602.1 multiple sugar transport system substrate-binding protein [Arthrobacter pigmenti]